MNRRQRPRAHKKSLSGSRRKERRSGNPLNNLIELRDNPINQVAFWSQDSYTLANIIDNNPLPQIVRCTSQLIQDGNQGLPVNIHIPMLICPGRSTHKMLAKHVGYSSRGQKLLETEESIVIPGDYEGNFLCLQARTTQDKSERKTLAQIANSEAQAFLSLSPITVFFESQITSNINRKPPEDAPEEEMGSVSAATHTPSSVSKTTVTSYVQKRVMQPPGSVYLILGVGVARAGGKMRSRDVTVLKCTDVKGNYLMIDTNQAGDFLEVVPPINTEQSRLSMKSFELMENNRYPSLVRFVYGDQTPRLRPCSNMFTLVDTFKEESAIGCLLYPKYAFMIELPIMSSLRFQLALNNEDLLNMHLVENAQEVVSSRRESFLTDLKLKFRFFHRVGHNEGIDSKDDLKSATVRTRMYANESFFYM